MNSLFKMDRTDWRSSFSPRSSTVCLRSCVSNNLHNIPRSLIAALKTFVAEIAWFVSQILVFSLFFLKTRHAPNKNYVCFCVDVPTGTRRVRVVALRVWTSLNLELAKTVLNMFNWWVVFQNDGHRSITEGLITLLKLTPGVSRSSKPPECAKAVKLLFFDDRLVRLSE